MHNDTTDPMALPAMECEDANVRGDASLSISARSTPDTEEAAVLAHNLRIVFGRNLRQSRLDEGLTRNEVAVLSGLAEHCVEQIEHGLTDPTLRDMTILALALGRELWTLLTLPET